MGKRASPSQRCPNCSALVDVGIYVSGQRASCPRCNIRFDVVRVSAERSLLRSPATDQRPQPSHTSSNGALGSAALQLASPASIPSRHLTEADKPRRDLTEIAGPPVIPGYSLEERIGRGGMGEVWRAQQTSLGRRVAIKLMAERYLDTPDLVTRFENESAALSTLTHPHIVGVIDCGRVGRRPFFVMEYVEGPSLREAIGVSGISLAEARAWGLQLCDALACAHGRGIIHRDLKPENVLLAGGRQAKLADFGLAALLQRDMRLTADAQTMGTAHYMAPEQRTDAKAVDARADLYSLGVLLYEMLTGNLPVGHYPPASERVGGSSPGSSLIDALLKRALAQDPANRFPNAAAMGEALRLLQA